MVATRRSSLLLDSNKSVPSSPLSQNVIRTRQNVTLVNQQPKSDSRVQGVVHNQNESGPIDTNRSGVNTRHRNVHFTAATPTDSVTPLSPGRSRTRSLRYASNKISPTVIASKSLAECSKDPKSLFNEVEEEGDDVIFEVETIDLTLNEEDSNTALETGPPETTVLDSDDLHLVCALGESDPSQKSSPRPGDSEDTHVHNNHESNSKSKADEGIQPGFINDIEESVCVEKKSEDCIGNINNKTKDSEDFQLDFIIDKKGNEEKEISNGCNEDAENDAIDSDSSVVDESASESEKLDFIIDKKGNEEKEISNECNEDSENDAIDSDSSVVDESASESEERAPAQSFISNLLPFTLINKKEKTKKKKTGKQKQRNLSRGTITLASQLQSGLIIESYIDTDVYKNPEKHVKKFKQAIAKKNDEILNKSVIQPGFEKLGSIPAFEEGLRQQKKRRRLERQKTKGPNWFNMVAPEMTEELKNDLTILQMRKSLDPKRFYKNNDTEGLPKFFQVGKIVETAADFYHSRVPKKQRKATLVDELMADAEFRQYNKRKFVEAQERDMSSKKRKFMFKQKQKKTKKK